MGVNFWVALFCLYLFGSIIPNLAVSVRRLHDQGSSGWNLLWGVVPVFGTIWLLILFCTEGESKENKYGLNPKEGKKDVNVT